MRTSARSLWWKTGLKLVFSHELTAEVSIDDKHFSTLKAGGHAPGPPRLRSSYQCGIKARRDDPIRVECATRIIPTSTEQEVQTSKDAR